jgi:hypothetical protein
MDRESIRPKSARSLAQEGCNIKMFIQTHRFMLNIFIMHVAVEEEKIAKELETIENKLFYNVKALEANQLQTKLSSQS